MIESAMDLLPLQGKLMHLGVFNDDGSEVLFELKIGERDVDFWATDTNKYSLSKIVATPYRYTNASDLSKPITRLKIFYGGQSGMYFNRYIVSQQYVGIFRDRKHYVDVVRSLLLDTLASKEFLY
jgi:hypothetical protein